MTNQPNQPNQPYNSDPLPSSEELSERIEHTRDELGRTAEALAAKADVRVQAKEKAADVKAQAMEKASVMTEQAASFVKDETPDPVLDEADRVATRAWSNRTPLIAIGTALIVILLVRRGRGRK